MELQRYWSIVQRRIWLIALVIVVVCGVAGLYASRMTKPEYQATVQLMVNSNDTSGKPQTEPNSEAISSSILLIKTYKQIMTTPRILNKVVEQYPDLHTTAGELGAKLSVASASETQLMSVTVTDSSYVRAAKLANAVSATFQTEIRALMKLDNVSVLNWADPAEKHGSISSSPTKIVAIAFILSLMIGVGLAFLLDRMDDSVKTDRDVARLGLSLLADVPRMRRRDLGDRVDLQKPTSAPGRKSHVTLDA
ncbi:YveK family protein [Cohnella zeiphila]|uniref:Lipopolysaccharide biosynthesis protein n=1 Tax=Cohnella zeiphila TaxID=2761120 RepID=A0A7X0SW88_9BACL|nr:Wzz/FepE/Etk N-terminal domain-containing protein [Cohnella zeiphila]MBB6735108.1 lipopolysaccharide biosynthesis protein [Cohnella zeiphila]